MVKKLLSIASIAALLTGLAAAAAEPAIPSFFGGGQTTWEGQIPTGTTAAILQARMAQANAPKAAGPARSASPFDSVVPSLTDTSRQGAPPAAPAPMKSPPVLTQAPKPTILDRQGMTLIAPLVP